MDRIALVTDLGTSRFSNRRSFKLLLFLLLLIYAELMARLAFMTVLRRFDRHRLYLSGELAEHDLPTTPEAYLHYIMTPGFVDDEGGVQHNVQGYRGPAVTMQRVPGVARVLCLGGSTTYGTGVHKPSESYPAQLEKWLNERLPPGVRGVEVINGGMPYAMSTEDLTHYEFKYHYFHPDLVIIDGGGNDVQPYLHPHYQPDYSHWAGLGDRPHPIRPWISRKLMHSRLAALLYILFTDGVLSAQGPYVNTEKTPTASWYPEALVQKTAAGYYHPPAEGDAFRHNMEVLVDMVKADGGKVLIVPFREAPRNSFKKSYLEGLHANQAWLPQLAVEKGVGYAPFPAEVIGWRHWADVYCHLTADGEREKAVYLGPFVRHLLFETAAPAKRFK